MAESSESPPTSPPVSVLVFAVLVALAHLYFNTLGLHSENRVSAFHFASFALLSLMFSDSAASKAKRVGALAHCARAWHLAVPILAAASGVYLISFEDALYQRGQTLSSADTFFAAAAILSAIELTRRTSGWVIPLLVTVSLSYVAWWGRYVPGVFSFPGLSAESLLFRLYFSPEGMFGLIARISWSYVFMFMLFGSFLLRSGGGDFVIALARAAAGRIRGGPGYVAVVASGLMGSISGSAIANTAATGTLTIPMMKRSGFSPRFAAAVEAAASTGGQLMPPVMGAGAFIMASSTQASYLTIVSVALLPALLYFFTVALFVYIEAGRTEPATGEPATGETATGETDKEPATGTGSLASVLSHGWHHAVPLLVLITLLIRGFSPTYAAAVAMASIVVVSWLRAALTREPVAMKLPDIAGALVSGARGMIATALLLVTIGLVVNIITTTGLGNTFSLMIVEWSGGSIALMLLLLALVSLVLGMGLPVTASYIVLATVAASALQGLLLEGWLVETIRSGEIGEATRQVLMLYGVSDPTQLASAEIRQILAGVPAEMKSLLIEQVVPASLATATLLTAHMILFWLSQDSNVTPPVCLAAFTAATLAGSRPMATGLTAWKLAKGLYVVPLLMAYQPFVGAGPTSALKVFVIGMAAMVALVGVLEGFGRGIGGWALRAACAGAACFFLAPGPSQELRFWSAAAALGLGLLAVGRLATRSGSPGPHVLAKNT